ncbi:MAG: M1 family metallopeptidase [Reichenbachiella sp.]
MRILLIVLLFVFSNTLKAQPFNKQDSLRGSITPEREWWDLKYYHLDIEIIPTSKIIKGQNTIQYQVLKPYQIIQIDLQSPLNISKVTQDGQTLSFISEGNAHFISLKKEQQIGYTESIIVEYSGAPREAVRAPWDGGITWDKDEKGVDFIASSCQGLGASVWWPCKDHMYDEVDSMLISVEVPKNLIDVSNGRLRSVEINKQKKTKTYNWFVSNPINNYGININIGNYANWKETYQGEKGPLDIDNWALKQNLSKAKKQWKQNHQMLEAFEHWFGPYPWYEDSYKLVEAPYLGMEHQSSVTYGNGFENGYLGRDLSGTGWGLKFDFIIVHEAGHEWFANNITHRDVADMWLHESFTSYAEGLFVEYWHGKEAGQAYTRGTRKNIQNQSPLIGPYNVNAGINDADVYYKGANILNMIRAMLDNDDKWLQILRGMNQEFWHQTITSSQMEDYITKESSLILDKFFDQFLRDRRVPLLEYYVRDGEINYRWTNIIEGFDMALSVKIDDTDQILIPTPNWQNIVGSDIQIDINYYVGLMKIQ